jgi:hypothetical protein|tara:strand:- start:187 stop:576 length:390 start_codon:yes stop_codon:yes gene_type:complete
LDGSDGRNNFLNALVQVLEKEMNLKSLTVVAFALFLSACSTKALDDMNYGLSKAMGEHVRLVEQALGKPAEVAREGNRTRYHWFTQSHIESCDVEVWADADGLVRKTSWTGYAGACERYAESFLTTFPQ